MWSHISASALALLVDSPVPRLTLRIQLLPLWHKADGVDRCVDVGVVCDDGSVGGAAARRCDSESCGCTGGGGCPGRAEGPEGGQAEGHGGGV